MDAAQDYFTAWTKAQQQAFEAMAEMTHQLQQSAAGFGAGPVKPAFGGFEDVFGAWKKSVGDAFGGAGAGDLLRDTLLKSMGGSNAYLKLYELWLPLFKALSTKGARREDWKDLADPAKYKELLDGVFGIDPDATARLAEQGRQLLEALSQGLEGNLKPWQQAFEKGLKSVPDLIGGGHPHTAVQLFHTMFGAFDATAGRFFHVPAVGKDREKVELLLRTMDALSVFMAKNTEYEHALYVTGTGAFEKVVAALAEKVEQGEKLSGFKEFFELWISVNEKAFAELFRTEAYAKLQGEQLSASLAVRQHYFKLMELHLYDLPIALRSEMDDLYKTVHELRRTVKGLEKKLKEVRA
jgi:polyhydroxyalkanoate synthase subunit PhaE